jgi:hypothetical protein
MIALTKEALREYHLREMALSDWTSGVNHAQREEAKKIARNLKAMGIPTGQIAQGTGLTIEQIELSVGSAFEGSNPPLPKMS